MSNLQYEAPNHNQEAQLYIDGRQIVRFSASVNGTRLPTYNAWLTPDVSEEDYQKYHGDIHEAYIEFVKRQSANESKLIDRIQASQSANKGSEDKDEDKPKTNTRLISGTPQGVEASREENQPTGLTHRKQQREED